MCIRDSIYGAVGYGGIASAYVVSRLLEEQRKAETPALPKVQEVTHEEAQRQLGKPCLLYTSRCV